MQAYLRIHSARMYLLTPKRIVAKKQLAQGLLYEQVDVVHRKRHS